MERTLTVRGEAEMAGVAVGTIIGVGLVHGLVHYSCHPDGQVGGKGEHETAPVWGGGAKRPVRGLPIVGPWGDGKLGNYTGR